MTATATLANHWFPARRAHGRARQRYVAIGIVTAIHVAVFWLLSLGMRAAVPTPALHELEVTLLSASLDSAKLPAPPKMTLQAPAQVLVPEPNIVIAPDVEDHEGVAAQAVSGRLPPRLDPHHLNEWPELPHTLGSVVASISLELRVLVLTDGSVTNAQILRSTGQADIDRLAIKTVEDSWHYLPALVNGKPTEAWTTVIVRFAAF